MRWTTSAQLARSNAVVALVVENCTCTVCEPAERLPLVRTISCASRSPDDLGWKTVGPVPLTPRSLLSKTAFEPAAGESSVPSTVIFRRHFWSAVPP
jgi:hypothetical protein